MILTRCHRADVHAIDNETIICSCIVTELRENSVILLIEDKYIDQLLATGHVSFFDEFKGLITFYCSISATGDSVLRKGVRYRMFECTLQQEVSINERRNDCKVPIDLPLSLILPTTFELPRDFRDYKDDYGIRTITGTASNLSAGGLYFTTSLLLTKENTYQIELALPGSKSIQALIELIRIEELPQEDKQMIYGYGCKFSRISSGNESAVRSLVFKEQLHRRIL